MNLLSINGDVKRLIIDHLSQADRRALCLVHSSLHRLCEPVLYSAVVFPNCDDYFLSSGHPIFSLLRSLVSRPQLASYVFTLSSQPRKDVYGLCVQECYHSWNLDKIPESELNQAVSFVSRTKVPDAGSWIAQLKVGRVDAWLAVLLLHLPRLRHLCLSQIYLVEMDWVGLALGSIVWGTSSRPLSPGYDRFGMPGRLECLETVSLLDRNDTNPSANTEHVLPFFYIPSVTEISVYMDEPDEGFSWPAPPRPDSGLQSLTLAKLTELHLDKLLSITPVLRSFTWHRYCCHEGYMEPSPFDSPLIIDVGIIMKALGQVKDTLRTLKIYTLITVEEVILQTKPIHIQNTASSAALASFDQLETLVIPLIFIVGFPPHAGALGGCLPRNLKSLTLTDELFDELGAEAMGDLEEYDYMRTVIPWLTNVKRDTPHLRELCLVTYWDGGEEETLDEESIQVREKIGELVHAAGIDLDWQAQCEGEYQLISDRFVSSFTYPDRDSIQ